LKAHFITFIFMFLLSVFAGASTETTIHSANGTRKIPSNYFGVHAWGFEDGHTPWPSAAVGAYRTWDSGAVWSSIEPSRGHYNWSHLDSIVSFMESKHVDVLFTLGRVPAWASSSPWTSCGGGHGQCMPPYSSKDWSDFIWALASRYKGRIKYYEVWNEPNASNWWKGSPGQLASLAKTAYSVIKQVDPGAQVVGPATQGLYAFQFADAYFAAGGPADIVSFHGYVGSSHGKTQAPEKWINVAQNMFSMMNRRGIHKPLWDTEFSWEFNYHLPSSYDQAAFLSRMYVLHWLYGVNRGYWDMYDGSTGTLWSGHLTQAGKAFEVLSKWLVGSSLDECQQGSDGTWACHMVRSNGKQAWILWNTYGSKQFQPSSSWGLHTQYDLYGGSRSISSTGSIGIAPLPVLVEGAASSAGGTGTGSGGDTGNSAGGTDFSMTATPTSVTVPAGQAASYQVALTPNTGFKNTVTLACSGAPLGNTCLPSVSALKFDGKSPVTVTFTVGTSPATMSAALLPDSWGWLGLLTATGALFLLTTERKMSELRSRVLVRLALVTVATFMLASCGGGFDAHNKSGVAVPPSNGSYSLTFSGTTGAVTHSTSVHLQVR